MDIKKTVPIIISAMLLSCVAAFSTLTKLNTDQAILKTATVSQASAKENKQPRVKKEMKGVWVTYMELSMEYEEDKSEAAFTAKFEKIAQQCATLGFNTIIAQVRPFCDALYESSYFPYSHILTGTQGETPDYDALKIMCDICKKYKLDIHAWVNPYRVSVNGVPEYFCEDNIYLKDPSMCIETENGIILDPSNKKSRELIVSGVKELVKNYDIDGIQFDDYFYPTDIGELDSEQYEAYTESINGEALALSEWRKSNVNLLLSEVYMTVHAEKNNAVFGISPQGNLSNNEELYADVKHWCECTGFADYICPQVYFSTENPPLSFEDALNDWISLNLSPTVSIYVGIAGYKAGTDADSGTWLESDQILAEEYRILNREKAVSGFMLYSYSSLIDETAENEIDNLTEAIK